MQNAWVDQQVIAGKDQCSLYKGHIGQWIQLMNYQHMIVTLKMTIAYIPNHAIGDICDFSFQTSQHNADCQI